MAAEGTTTDLSEAWPSVADMLEDIEKQGGASCVPPEDLLSRYGATVTQATEDTSRSTQSAAAADSKIRSPDAAFCTAKKFIDDLSTLEEESKRLDSLSVRLDGLSSELLDAVGSTGNTQ